MNWKLAVGAVISAVFLYLAFRKVDVQELKAAMAGIRYAYLVPAVLLVFLILLLRAFRWRFLLRPIKAVGMRSLFSAIMIGYMANNLLPARLGEIVRAYTIGEKERISKSSSFATIVVERIFDGLSILFFLAVILVFFSVSFPGWIRRAALVSLGIYVAAMFFLVLLTVKADVALSIAGSACRLFPERIGRLVMRLLDSFIYGLRIIRSTRNIVFSAALSIVIWIPTVLIINLLLTSMDIDLPIFASFLLLVILSIGVMIPSAPGFIGTVQFFSVAGLALFSVPKSQALSFSIIYHAVSFIPVTGVGLVYFFREGISFGDVERFTKTLNTDHSEEKT